MNDEFFSWKKIVDKALERLQTQEFSRVIPLVTPVQVLAEGVNRNNGYQALITVAGVGSLPAQLRGIWYQVQLSSPTATIWNLTVSHPSTAAFQPSVGSQGAITISGGGFSGVATSGANAGKIIIQVNSGANPGINSIALSVFGYLL